MSYRFIEIYYMVCFWVLLVGAAKSYRDNGSRLSIAIISSAFLMDLAALVLEKCGVFKIPSNLHINMPVLFSAIGLAWITYALFITALTSRYLKKMTMYHICIGLLQLTWFTSSSMFFFALHGLP